MMVIHRMIICAALPLAFSAMNVEALEKKKEGSMFDPVDADTFVAQVIAHPAFTGFGEFVLPTESGRVTGGMRLRDIRPLLPYHGQIDTATTVAAINYLIDVVNDNKTVFYDIYDDRQKLTDIRKNKTGLFYFRGKPGAPFAIICPGGGFSYVGSIHEGFPYALVLSRKGYNAFVLQYRVGGELIATEDLAAAITYIFNNAASLGISVEGYSVWGSSAGARIAAIIGALGTERFGGRDLPKPSTVVMAYTDHSSFSFTDPPTFVTVSADDRIVNVATVERRVEAMGNAGIEVEYRRYRNAGHGFGLGIGTDAEGWIDLAIQFWERHIKVSNR